MKLAISVSSEFDWETLLNEYDGREWGSFLASTLRLHAHAHMCVYMWEGKKGKKNTVASERETSKNMIRKAEYMVHSMTASKRVQVWVPGGSGCSEPHWEAETGRRWGEESIGVLILPAKATALKHRPWNRNGASTLEEQLQACGGLCRSLEGLWVFWDGITRLSAGASWFGIAQWDSYTFDSVGNFELDTLYKAPSTILFRIQWMQVTGPGLGPNWEMWMGGRERMRQVLSPVTVLWGPCFYFGKWNTDRQQITCVESGIPPFALNTV